MRKQFLHIAIIAGILSGATGATPLFAKKVKLSLKVDKEKKNSHSKKTKGNKDDNPSSPRGIWVEADNETCRLTENGDSLIFYPSSIKFAGYDKEASSPVESFLLVNDSGHTVIRFRIKIVYKDMNGRMLHSREVEKECLVPGKEARKLDIPSWDRQKTYYYYLGNSPRRVATPYKVEIIPISYNLEIE